ncbi:hypothetical protein SCP_0112570 [Sparassis crispa]|uniref:Uncharacterized protein n=1 Tax=Sparassis crispa TaxID=139825 RepID=A0A401G884_9APHY|nr:hypothetical protein SCP_0112570 [Sparassis crispa]GBE78372.1 hypothetical protein SCP_0112570 [Sparassis crispa]
MPLPSKSKREDKRYEYQKQKVPCWCEGCKGKHVPQYTQHDHQTRPRYNSEKQSDDERGSVKLGATGILKKLAKKLKLSPKKNSTGLSTASPPSPSQTPQPDSRPYSVGEAEGVQSHYQCSLPSPMPVDFSNDPSYAPKLCQSDSANILLAVEPEDSILEHSGEVLPYHGEPALDLQVSHSAPVADDTSSGSARASQESVLSYATHCTAISPAPDLGVQFDVDVNDPDAHNLLGPNLALDANVQPAMEPCLEMQVHQNADRIHEDVQDMPHNVRYVPHEVHEVPRDMPPNSIDIFTDAAEHWFWRVLLLLCSWLHLHYHVPYCTCALILQVMQLIFVAVGLLSTQADAPTTLLTAIKRLHLGDNFEIKAMCPSCRRIFPSSPSLTLRCSSCNIPLFKRVAVRARLVLPLEAFQADDAADTQAQVPLLQTPFSLLSEQLPAYVNRLEGSLDPWRVHPQTPPGQLWSMQDGKLWQTLLGPDGQMFFYNGQDRTNPDELRIGITLHFDGFGYQRSQFSGKHSTGVLSNCFANLEVQDKYQSRNLVLCGITPGPKELSADELQHFMKAYVDDLLKLYDDRTVIKMKLQPEGRRVHVLLLAVCCDHPALCRIVGFGDHNTKEGFCSRCKIKHADLETEAGMTIGAFPARDGEEHRQHAQEYLQEMDPQRRAEFFMQHATRYYELSHLPYFDAVRMTVVDPMHNILLGVVKTQWLDAWINTKALRERTAVNKVCRELDQVHEYLKIFEMPQWVARLPNNVGYAAGGSLTADEWKGMALNYCPIIVPLIWDKWQPSAEATYEKRMKKWKADNITHL